MDNIGPIALFILYMAISAWAKKNKAQRRAAREAGSVAETAAPKEPSFMGGIFEQLKNELLEAQEEPQFIPPEAPEPVPDAELVIDEPMPEFVEGSGSLLYNDDPIRASSAGIRQSAVSPLETMLEPYSKIEQGIILHEILGKPRAYQDNNDWFHVS